MLKMFNDKENNHIYICSFIDYNALINFLSKNNIQDCLFSIKHYF